MQIPVVVLPTAAERERLELIIEECSEIIQAATKITRHGFENYNPNKFPNGNTNFNNRWDLEKEIGHFFNAVNMLLRANDIRILNIFHEQDEKSRNVDRWLRHQ